MNFIEDYGDIINITKQNICDIYELIPAVTIGSNIFPWGFFRFAKPEKGAEASDSEG